MARLTRQRRQAQAAMQIASLMHAREWDADLCDEIAAILRQVGFIIGDVTEAR